MPTKDTPETADPLGFKNLVDLFAVYAEAKARLEAMEGEVNDEFIGLVDKRREEYAGLQQTIADTEAAIEEIAILNPQWFKKAKSVKTPYGSVGCRKTSKLVVPNEEVTILLIEQRGKKQADAFIRTKKELDLEALEKLADEELKALRIRREETDSWTVKAAKVDLGKAVAKTGDDKAA